VSKVQVYQFEMYDVHEDVLRISRRWGTIEGIKRIGGAAFGAAVEVDKAAVEPPMSDLAGLTAIGFDPHRGTGFPTSVKA